MNKDRGLVQFYNGRSEKKAEPMTYWYVICLQYGHVAIISEVGKDYIVVAQQNSSSPFAKIGLKKNSNQWTYPIQIVLASYDYRR